MALIGKAYNPFGIGSGGSGLASGFKYAQGLKDRQTFAEGFNEYVNATDNAQKNSALAKMASVDGQNAVRLMDNSLQRELANRQLAQKQAEFDWQKEKFGQMTPAQEAQLDLQRQNLELNRGNVEYTRSKDLEAKEKEKALGQAISEYYIAQDDDGRNAALSKAAMIDPKATSDFYKKIKTREALWTTDYGRKIAILSDPNEPQWKKDLVLSDLQAEAQMPQYKGQIAYESAVGKQYAEAGIPYGAGQPVQAPVQNPIPSTFGGYMDTQTPQAQAMPMQAQPIPTAAELKAAETEAVKTTENRIDRENTDADLERKKPILKDALIKALDALKSGKGSGVLEGYATKFGLNPNAWFDKSYSQNYAAVENAGRLINQYVRQSLKNAGLTGKELDSAAEANRYLYELNPTNNEQINEARIINFINDFMPEILEEEGIMRTEPTSTMNAYKAKYGLE